MTIKTGAKPTKPSRVAATKHAPSNLKPAPAQKPLAKIDAVLTLLRGPSGAKLPQLIEATGWLPHTVRAALTGLRKRGHDVQRTKEGDVSIYRVAN